MRRGRERGVGVGRKLSAGDGLVEKFDNLAPAAFVGDPLAHGHGRQIRREFAFVIHHVEHRLRARIAREARQSHHGHLAQRAQRICAAPGAGAAQHGFHRHCRALAHRLEQLGLVAEVPVDRTAGQAGGVGNIGERRMRDPLVAEFALRRIEQRLACRYGLRPRLSCHFVTLLLAFIRDFDIPIEKGVANIHECM